MCLHLFFCVKSQTHEGKAPIRRLVFGKKQSFKCVFPEPPVLQDRNPLQSDRSHRSNLLCDLLPPIRVKACRGSRNSTYPAGMF